MKQIFRKVAVEKSSSPERLDSLMQVTTPTGWLALVGLALVIAAAAVWGFLGEVPDDIAGSGILLRQGGFFDVESSGSGSIAELLVKPGDTVKIGDALARIDLPELEQQIEQAQNRLGELESDRARAVDLIQRNLDLQTQSTREAVERLHKEGEALAEQETYLVKRLEAQRKAVELGLITDDQAQATAQQLSATRASIVGHDAELSQLQATLVAAENSAYREIFQLGQQTEDAERQLAAYQLEHDQRSVTYSLLDGRIVELLQDEGHIAMRGGPIMTLELSAQDLEALIFIPMQGSRVKPGMAVHLSPEGISWEEYGYMEGTVTAVSDAPVSPESMNRVLRNPTLVQQFAAGGGAYLVTVAPEFDSSTPTGFKWTSRRGPDGEIGTGTLLTGTVTVHQRRPITLVIPALRRWLGI